MIGMLRSVRRDQPAREFYERRLYAVWPDEADSLQSHMPDAFTDLTPLAMHDAFGLMVMHPVTPLRQASCPACGNKPNRMTYCSLCQGSGLLLCLH